MQTIMMEFELPSEKNESIIKVIGVGGGGSNAVNHMYKMGIKGVDFIVCNTDKQSLDISPVPTKISLGITLTQGLGAGSVPEVGRNAAIENLEEIKNILSTNTKMVFITAGMGGGTGTGAAPIIAKTAKEMGILTVGIVTIPFAFEGKKRKQQAEEGLDEMKKSVDTLLVINNDKLREIYGNLRLTDAFGHADNVLTIAAKGIADIITTTLHINTDFADIQTVMKESGVAIMGSATASGENRALQAVQSALSSPLLNDSDIRGARYVLLNITCGKEEITMDELGDITDYIQEAAGQSADLIKGYGIDPSLEDKVNITIIATGFQSKGISHVDTYKKPEIIVRNLEESNTAPTAELSNTTVVNTELSVPPSVEEPFLIVKKDEPVATQSNEIVFEVTNSETSVSEVKQEEPVANIAEGEQSDELFVIKKIESDELKKRSQERINKLKELSLKIKSPDDISRLENEPAYKRRQVELNNVAHSSESQVSRFTLSEGEDNKTEIKPNNSFLHDNVD